MARRENVGSSAAVVCVVTFHPLAGRYLIEALEAESDLAVTRWQDLEQKAERRPTPHVFVLDLALLPDPLSRFLHALRSNFPESKYIVLGGNASEPEIVKLLFLGAHGYLTYDQVPEALATAVRGAMAGNVWVPRRVLQRYINVSSRMFEASARWSGAVTKREREIVELLLRRLSNKEIANALGISESTVKFHLTHIFAKFQVSDRAALQESITQQRMLDQSLAPETSQA
jgi:DNA-binding NarL/FixJ family response regulator